MARECMGESTCLHLHVCEATSASNQWLHEQAGLWVVVFSSKSTSLITDTVLCGLLGSTGVEIPGRQWQVQTASAVFRFHGHRPDWHSRNSAVVVLKLTSQSACVVAVTLVFRASFSASVFHF